MSSGTDDIDTQSGPRLPWHPFDGMEVDHPTAAEIASVVETVPAPGATRDTLRGWRLIALRYVGFHYFEIVVLAHAQDDGGPYVTSAVNTLDLDNGLVQTTTGSVYRLVEPAAGDPPPLYRAQLKRFLLYRGWGDERDVA